MCHFAANITSFGKKGCISSKLKNYDYIMRIDDDSWFKKRINFDFFKKIKNYPMATGRLTKMKRKDVDLTRENLLKFYNEQEYHQWYSFSHDPCVFFLMGMETFLNNKIFFYFY